MSMADFWDCSLWEFECAVEGYRKANTVDDKPQAMTPERYEELCRQHGYEV